MDSHNIICNSSPLINLSKIHQLDLIEKLYRKILTPNAVYDELIGEGSRQERSDEIHQLIAKGI